jgi:hypothetical protein
MTATRGVTWDCVKNGRNIRTNIIHIVNAIKTIIHVFLITASITMKICISISNYIYILYLFVHIYRYIIFVYIYIFIYIFIIFYLSIQIIPVICPHRKIHMVEIWASIRPGQRNAGCIEPRVVRPHVAELVDHVFEVLGRKGLGVAPSSITRPGKHTKSY